MKKSIITAVLGLGLVTGNAIADQAMDNSKIVAEATSNSSSSSQFLLDGDVSGGVTFATDIRYDGVTFNSEEGALIGWLDYAFKGVLEGFFVGIWAANQANDDYSLELDYYAGYGNSVGAVDYYFGYMYYDYLGSEAGGSDGEFFLGFDYSFIGLYFEWDGGRDGGPDDFNPEGNEIVSKISFSGDLPHGFGGTFAAAQKYQENADNYGYYELAITSPTVKGVVAEFSYVGLDSSENDKKTSAIFSVTREF